MRRLRWWLADRLRPNVWPSTAAQHAGLLDQVSELHTAIGRFLAAVDAYSAEVMDADGAWRLGGAARRAWAAALDDLRRAYDDA